MKKKLLLIVTALICALTCALGLVACDLFDNGDGDNSDHKHAYASEWVFDETYHWHECTAGYECEGSKKLEHKDANNDKVCDECDNRIPSKGLVYETGGSDGYIVKGIGTCTDTEIVIPMYSNFDEYWGYAPVSDLGYSLFVENEVITSVIIPESVKYIGAGAFSNCTALESVTIGKSVTEIGNGAFSGCGSLLSVVIPDSVKTIKNGAFSYCESLKSVTIGKNVESIEYDVFANAPIETLTFVDSTVPLKIGNNVFSYMPITSLSVPDRIICIGKSVFSNLSVNYTEYENCYYVGNASNPYFALVKAIDDKSTSYKVHADTKVISGFAFCGSNTNITIEMPVGVKGIGAWLCSGRYSVDIQYKGTVAQFKAIEQMEWGQGVNFWSVTCTDGGDHKK